jgi:hypothetical protein
MMNTMAGTLCSSSSVILHLQNTTTLSIIYWVFNRYACICQSQWPCGLRHGSVANNVIGLLVQIPLGAWMCLKWVLSGEDLWDKLITHPEESYLVWRVIVKPNNEEALAHYGLLCHG